MSAEDRTYEGLFVGLHSYIGAGSSSKAYLGVPGLRSLAPEQVETKLYMGMSSIRMILIERIRMILIERGIYCNIVRTLFQVIIDSLVIHTARFSCSGMCAQAHGPGSPRLLHGEAPRKRRPQRRSIFYSDRQ